MAVMKRGGPSSCWASASCRPRPARRVGVAYRPDPAKPANDLKKVVPWLARPLPRPYWPELPAAVREQVEAASP